MTHKAIIMAAPNGARKTKRDHRNLPVTIDDTVAEAARCYEAGATMLHAHVRGDEGEHVLDPARYRRLFEAMHARVPEMWLQMTTEAVGRYTPPEQAECVYALAPGLISMAVREMAGEDADLGLAREFYAWNAAHRVHVQHIVYDDRDLARLFELQGAGVVPAGRPCVLFVLGRYLEHRESEPEDIDPFLATKGDEALDWFVCAFGSREHDCALAAVAQGGHARIGFENNLLRPDGNPADYTADQVAALKRALVDRGHAVADSFDTARILGLARR